MSRILTALATAPTAVFSSTAARVRELEGADRVIRAPLSLSHRIAFAQLTGGTGASTVSAAVASLLAHRRPGPVLGVNASGGTRTLLWQVGATGDDPLHTPVTTPNPRRLRPTSFADASASLHRAASGLYTLDVRAPGSGIAATESDWATPVAPITRFFDAVCTDWGVRRPELDLGGVAAGSHAVCLVARGDRSSLEEAVAVADALRALENRPHVVVAAVDLGDTAGRAPEAVRWGAGSVIIRVPFDPARSSAAPVSSDRLSSRSRLALTRLAAELMPRVRSAAQSAPAAAGRTLDPTPVAAAVVSRSRARRGVDA